MTILDLECKEEMTEDCDYFEVGVIGSGFGGCIAAIELAKVFKNWDSHLENWGWDAKNRYREVCILERGVWNISPEAWNPNNEVAKFIDKDSRPYQFWAQPDTSRGLLNLFGMLRTIPYITGFLKLLGQNKVNHRGLYDMKNYDQTFSIVASGVGGGSLIYSGVIACPEPEILDKPYSDDTSKPDSVWKPSWKIHYNELEPYMMYAKYKFIGVNKVYSLQPGNSDKEWMMLPKTRALRSAVDQLKRDPSAVDQLKRDGLNNIEFEFADLALTEAPSKNTRTNEPKGFCKRHGRCNMGCLPGARNTLNKKLVTAINKGLPITVKELAEVIQIEPINDGKDGYWINYLDHRTDVEDHWIHFFRYRSHRAGGKRRRIRVKKLILAAGTYGTTGLLLRSKQELGEKWNFSDRVGKQFSLNGDTFGFVTPTEKPVYPTVGPIDTAKVSFKKDGKHLFTIEDATIPRMFASTFGSLIEAHLKILTEDRTGHITKTFFRYPRMVLEFVLARDRDDIARFIRVMKKFVESRGWFPANEGLHSWVMGAGRHQKPGGYVRNSPGKFSQQDLDELDDAYRISNVFFFACMGVDHADAEATKWNIKTGELDMKWNSLADDKKDTIYEKIRTCMSLLGDKMVSPDTRKEDKSEYQILNPMLDLFRSDKKRLSIHPIGGCPMETEGGTGAVSCFGALMKIDGTSYQNLYIADGSIIPTALGVNPSLTISGLAFRIVDEIIRTNYNNAKPVLKNVVVGGSYPVTIRECTKDRDLGLAVATFDEKDPDNPEYDNLAYVEGPDPNNLLCKNEDLTSLPTLKKVFVKVNRIEDKFHGRIAICSIVDQP